MADRLHHTKGIVLRSVRYGDTSLILTIYTELFGLQSYIVNGVRTSSLKSGNKASHFQPTAILDLVVYHNELKQLQRIREFKWAVIYKNILTDVPKNAVALFMTELISKCLKEPEPNPDLFAFFEDSFLHLDSATEDVMANFPMFFALHLPSFFGFRIDDNYSEKNQYLDLMEGSFTSQQPHHPHFLDEKQSAITAQLLRVMQPAELADIKLNRTTRRSLLVYYEKFYALHLQDFGTLRTLPIIREILG